MKTLLRIIYAAIIVSIVAFGGVVAQAADRDINYQNCALTLSSLDLVQGTNGDYNLAAATTRLEAAVLYCRLLGVEKQAQAAKIDTTFSDVPQWASYTLGYLEKNGYVKGLGDGQFGSGQKITPAQFATNILRALGYQDGNDFKYSEALNFALKIGLITNADYDFYSTNSSYLIRGEAFYLEYRALSQKIKKANGSFTNDNLAGKIKDPAGFNQREGIANSALSTAPAAPASTVSSIQELQNILTNNSKIEAGYRAKIVSDCQAVYGWLDLSKLTHLKSSALALEVTAYGDGGPARTAGMQAIVPAAAIYTLPHEVFGHALSTDPNGYKYTLGLGHDEAGADFIPVMAGIVDNGTWYTYVGLNYYKALCNVFGSATVATALNNGDSRPIETKINALLGATNGPRLMQAFEYFFENRNSSAAESAKSTLRSYLLVLYKTYYNNNYAALAKEKPEKFIDKLICAKQLIYFEAVGVKNTEVIYNKDSLTRAPKEFETFAISYIKKYAQTNKLDAQTLLNYYYKYQNTRMYQGVCQNEGLIFVKDKPYYSVYYKKDGQDVFAGSYTTFEEAWKVGEKYAASNARVVTSNPQTFHQKSY